MTKVKKYFANNLILLQVFAQFRPEPNWPLIFKLFYYLYRVFIFFCFACTLIFSYVGIRVYGFVQISDIAMNILNLRKLVYNNRTIKWFKIYLFPNLLLLVLYTSISLRSTYFIFNHKRVEFLVMRMNFVMKESSTLSPNPVTMERGRRISDWCLFGWWAFVGGAGLFLAFAPLFNEVR